MSYLHRVTPNKATSQNIEAIYNEKGQMLDANTKEVLVQGQIDKGHKHGYEEQAMRVCAERCHMTQKEYNKMMQNPKLYQFESSHNNRSHKFESNISLKDAVMYAGEDFCGRQHDALVDARNTADLFGIVRDENKCQKALQHVIEALQPQNNFSIGDLFDFSAISLSA